MKAITFTLLFVTAASTAAAQVSASPDPPAGAGSASVGSGSPVVTSPQVLPDAGTEAPLDQPPLAVPPAVDPVPLLDDPLTSAAWRKPYRFELLWRVLMFPERALELATLPLKLLVSLAQGDRLERQVIDLLKLHDGRINLSPQFNFSSTDGVAVGGTIQRSKLFSRRAAISLGGVVWYNRDWFEQLAYDHSLLLPGGRGLRAAVFAEHDKNQPFYGVGGDTLESNRRVMKADEQGLQIETDLQGIDRYTFSGIAQVAMRRQTLAPGSDGDIMAVGTSGDPVAPPVGFGRAALYVDAKVAGRWDTRDTIARPTRGEVIDLGALLRSDVTGKHLSAAVLSGNAQLYLPVLPDGRVLILSAGGTAALPLIPGDNIPLDSLALIDRTNVRGYNRERFRDRYAIHASAEYRFPIYEYLTSRAGLDAFAFLDLGTAFGKADFSLDPLRYSVGGGLRAAHEVTLVFQGTIAWSPEGPQIALGIERLFL